MPKAVITTEGFPHGTTNGYHRGCNCAPCRRAKARKANWIQLRKSEGVPLPNDWLPAAPAREHVNTLAAAHPAINYTVIARAAGVTPQAIHGIGHGRTTLIRRRIAEAVLAVTVETALQHRPRIPGSEVLPLVRQLQAAGYGIRWLKQQGVDANHLIGHHRTGTVTPKAAAHIRQLHADYADTPATPERTGMPAAYIRRVRAHARGFGYTPAYHLDENGDLDPRSIPDHPWSQLDEKAARRLDVVRDSLAGMSVAELAKKWQLEERRIQRWFASAGFRTSDLDSVARARSILDEYDYGDADPVTTALRMRLLSDRNIRTDLAAHPGVQAYRELLESDRRDSARAA